MYEEKNLTHSTMYYSQKDANHFWNDVFNRLASFCCSMKNMFENFIQMPRIHIEPLNNCYHNRFIECLLHSKLKLTIRRSHVHCSLLTLISEPNWQNIDWFCSDSILFPTNYSNYLISMQYNYFILKNIHEIKLILNEIHFVRSNWFKFLSAFWNLHF